jgi:hypothetical protein
MDFKHEFVPSKKERDGYDGGWNGASRNWPKFCSPKQFISNYNWRRSTMRPFVWLLSILFLTTSLVAAAPPESKGTAALEQMKSLEGVWEGKDPEGNPVTVSYKVVSAGSSVEETIDHDKMGKGAMITMYHLDGDKLMMTHYCSMGNQPKMRLTKSTPTSMVFSFVSATNMSSLDDAHMHKLVLTWKDKDHISHEWTMRAKGKDESPVVFKLARKS